MQRIPGRLFVKQAGAARQRLLQMLPPPGAMDRLRFALMQNADANGRIGIKQTGGEKLIVPVINHGEFARFPRAILPADTRGEHPGMPAAHDAFRRGGQPQPQRRSSG